MQSGYNTWNLLSQLQRQLKKQFLLVEKEQQEKIKLKRQIQQLVRSYHQFYIDLHYPGAELLKEEGFDNCYNFIKDVVTGISNNCELGKAILFYASEQTTLASLLIHGLYQNLQTNDAYGKDITRLMYNLICELHSQMRAEREKQKIVQAWKIYMQKIQHMTYFQQIAYPTILQLLKQEKDHAENSQQTPQGDKNKHKKKFKLQAIEKEKLLQNFIDRVEVEAQMCLSSIKIPLRGLFVTHQQQNKDILRKIWVLMSYFYLQPFVKVIANNQVPQIVRQNILQFVDQLVTQWGFTGELAFQSLQLKQTSSQFAETKLSRILKIVHKLIQVNQQRMACFISGTAQSTGQIQIKITGGCLSLVQLRDLLILLNSHKQVFSKINERVINRTIKIFEISHNLQVLNRDRPGMQFSSLAELKYEESISSDYYKNYTAVYKDETLKKMLKQVLVQTQNIWDLRSQQRNSLAEIFDGLVTQNRQYHTGAAISAQLQMKINYLIYLLGKRQAGGQYQLLLELKQDLKTRDTTNIRLFQDTKFSLLKVYCNLRSLKSQLKQQKEGQRKCVNKISLIHRLQELRLDFCTTSKASRNIGQTQGQQSIDKYRYRLSTADDILIQPISQCIHKDNVFTGRLNHSNSVGKLIAIFANLQEVKHFIAYPTFTGLKSTNNRYFYCNEAKIGEAFHNFLKMVVQKIKEHSDDKLIIENVILRLLNEMLLGTNKQPKISHGDRLLLQKIEFINESRNKQLQSPRKKALRRKGSHQFIQGVTGDSSLWGSNESQLYQMGKRYLNSLIETNTSAQKIRKLRQMVEMYKIALGRNDSQTKATNSLQSLIEKSIMAAQPVNFISQLSFIEMFLAQEKLMSGDGKVLKQFQKAIQKIFKTQVVFSAKKNMKDI